MATRENNVNIRWHFFIQTQNNTHIVENTRSHRIYRIYGTRYTNTHDQKHHNLYRKCCSNALLCECVCVMEPTRKHYSSKNRARIHATALQKGAGHIQQASASGVAMSHSRTDEFLMPHRCCMIEWCFTRFVSGFTRVCRS